MVKKLTIVNFLYEGQASVNVSPLIKEKYGHIISTLDTKDEDFITAVELAEILRVKRQTVWNWIRKNNIPHIRIGKNYAIPVKELVRVYG